MGNSQLFPSSSQSRVSNKQNYTVNSTWGNVNQQNNSFKKVSEKPTYGPWKVIDITSVIIKPENSTSMYHNQLVAPLNMTVQVVNPNRLIYDKTGSKSSITSHSHSK